MNDDEFVPAADAYGILRCLRALAQEASSLHMLRTLSAIEDALEAAARESGMDCLEDVSNQVNAGILLH
jgi:hypothetical protein